MVGGLKVYSDMLASEGYHVGFTGKGCGPTDWKAAGRETNPAGAAYNRHFHRSGSKGISNTDYARNFKDFLEQRPQGAPFCFWYGDRDPHRVFQKGIPVPSARGASWMIMPVSIRSVSNRASLTLRYHEMDHHPVGKLLTKRCHFDIIGLNSFRRILKQKQSM